jgi:hypothetical protein
MMEAGLGSTQLTAANSLCRSAGFGGAQAFGRPFVEDGRLGFLVVQWSCVGTSSPQSRRRTVFAPADPYRLARQRRGWPRHKTNRHKMAGRAARCLAQSSMGLGHAKRLGGSRGVPDGPQ